MWNARTTSIVEGYDREGQLHTYDTKDFFARVVQHELDHLDGIVYLTRKTDPPEGFNEPPEEQPGMNIAFLGTPEFAIPSLNMLVQTGHTLGWRIYAAGSSLLAATQR